MPQVFLSSLSYIAKLGLVIVLLQSLVACAPKVGSPEWCEAISKKSAGDLTVNEAKDYMKHCILK